MADTESTRPFRFGVVSAAVGPGERWTRTATQVESMGFTTLLTPDGIHTHEPYLACATAAAVTTRLVVGQSVAVSGLRTPGMTAWLAGSLHELSGGRFELGLGLGRPDADADSVELGTPLPRTGRMEQLTDVLDAVAALPQERRPPVMIAAGGPKMLRLAGARADTVTIAASPFATAAEVAGLAGQVREGAAGRERAPELAVTLFAVGDADLPAWVKDRLPVDVGQLAASGSFAVVPGSPRQIADELRRRREASGVSYICAGAHLLEAMAPVVELLSGE